MEIVVKGFIVHHPIVAGVIALVLFGVWLYGRHLTKGKSE
jgi:predicted RND superfamily exporter protein